MIVNNTVQGKTWACRGPGRCGSPRGSAAYTNARRRPVAAAAEKGGREYAMTLPGILNPTGYFDPLGLSDNVGPGEMKRWREAELQHGRLSMLASIGWLVGEQPAVEANPLFNGAVSGPALRQFQQVEAEGGYFWEILVIGIGLCEVYRALYGWEAPQRTSVYFGGGSAVLREDYTPGEIGWDPLNLWPSEPEKQARRKNTEISNGRLAMIGIAGMVAQEEVDGMKILDHLFGAAA